MKYFSRFPIVNYANTLAVNILTRVQILESVRKQSTVFYPYTMKDGERPDTISYDYYDDVGYDWMIYLANQVVDPYYGVYLNSTDFENYIETKYGSTANASSTILFYRNDWPSDDSVITIGGYEALPQILKKYWNAEVDMYNNVTGYVRKQTDWTISTNQIISLNVSANTADFVIGEQVTNDEDDTAQAQLTFANSSTVILQHITGDWTSNTFTINCKSSGNELSANTPTIVANTLDPDEMVYYSAVDAYTYEMEQNNSKKDILLLDNRFIGTVDKDMQRLLNS